MEVNSWGCTKERRRGYGAIFKIEIGCNGKLSEIYSKNRLFKINLSIKGKTPNFGGNKEMKHKQKQPYGCGLYAVANACNLDDFITDERLEISKSGNTVGQLSKWMQDDGKPYYIDALFFDLYGTKLPETALSYKPSGENVNLLPILINCRFSEDGLNHLVGGKISKEGVLYLYDSLKEEMIETTLKEVNEMYHHVYGLFVLNSLNNEGYVFI